MSTSIKVKNEAASGGHSVVATITNHRPSTHPPTKVVIAPGEEHEFLLTEVQGLNIDESNGLNH